MSTNYEFDNEAIESFCNNHGVTLPLTSEQLDSLSLNGRTPLLVEQISNVADQLCPDEESLRIFIEQGAAKFHPISLSLYVINDDLWRIMSRRQEHHDKMLPMTTIPCFYWDREAKGKHNPAGVRRISYPESPILVNLSNDKLHIAGRGGDFCGLLEGRIVNSQQGIRPIIVPGSPGPRETVPKYESEKIQIGVNIHSSKIQLYPRPIKELDYFFSEHPRAFYEHGIQIDTNGEYVTLRVGRRRETTLRGQVILLIGKDFKDETDTDKIIMFHVWLTVMSRIPFL